MSYEMYKEKVFAGPEITLFDILDARENRVRQHENIFLEHGAMASLLSVTLNIPGNIKTSDFLIEIFEKKKQEIYEQLKAEEIIYSKTYHLQTGSETYMLIQSNPFELKKKMALLEEKSTAGRLFDIDILIQADGEIRAIKREEIGLARRKCFICQKTAKECARSREHSVEEIKRVIIALLTS